MNLVLLVENLTSVRKFQDLLSINIFHYHPISKTTIFLWGLSTDEEMELRVEREYMSNL
jgi:hypothetical protein